MVFKDLILIHSLSLTAGTSGPGRVKPLKEYRKQIQPFLLQVGWPRRGSGLKSKSSPPVVWVQEGRVLAG